MSRNLPILLGVFVVMALSNAVVPVLPAFAGGAAMQGAVYAAYFFGAFVTVLPADGKRPDRPRAAHPCRASPDPRKRDPHPALSVWPAAPRLPGG
ncbi:exported protein of unknown function [Methanoculleus bourgensis]|uniref:Uncharacterized protein n=1 Tax=Methanoculleus bourgensis TaxID=83986 RepID=A0A0X3BNZ7_9EURY|nr:exported protein of unknown function [Methanoculleus bourgensis]